MEHDDDVHHPLGGASYYFKKDLISYIDRHCTGSRITLHVGAQPNSDPHIGNLVPLAMAFALAAALQRLSVRQVRVVFVAVETAPDPAGSVIEGGVQYQKSLALSSLFRSSERAFANVLNDLSTLSGVQCDLETQDIWRKNPHFGPVLTELIRDRDVIATRLSPSTNKLAIRAPCPKCGLEDKHGLINQYRDDGAIVFTCPKHGSYEVNVNSPDQCKGLGMNTPLRNLVRMMICSIDVDTSWILCTGADYAGFYQEQMLYGTIKPQVNLPMLLYAPLIVDWSDAKLSKSLYVKQNAYKYLRNPDLEYLLNAEMLLEAESGLEALFAEVQQWVAEPYRLFRTYSIEYMHGALLARGMKLGGEAGGIERPGK